MLEKFLLAWATGIINTNYSLSEAKVGFRFFNVISGYFSGSILLPVILLIFIMIWSQDIKDKRNIRL